ncbi:hypothetical protein CBS115989_1678 [Aspergillus niger]|uniref:Contig An04c0140, genomic contig n=3 Tax=Aspergillus niger TaxID=5061 RepID=A2QIS9_ASPNC|nr:uncharacterized protein An04g04590 [Aspergillus niger]RDH20259.1 hypothetical protein M747DRAFT_351300 [Aspergillus niger ATCC 13496]KAI2822968.1 hypothetical protein CBS115989_1678 [Aspergillus niger]KAI2825346.1 hypothetical protein CBS133816_8590 [Aspergillus niger]KAI2858954.1 hypothetical protein CBS11232_2326 [Aspergillus niger]KAI2873269.1 hypothetical protein CBS115988_7135 [Aspergillus niger]|eukprot:XP_001401825.1 hypothetical protein ANI_1_1850184 [Aspergillus niger CBS 513.88]
MAATVVSSTEPMPNMTPDYEVRLLLNPAKVLSSEHELTDNVRSALNLAPTAIKLNVQFLDTCAKEIYTAGWSARIRKADNEDDLELTYKKRYAVTDGNIDSALTATKNDGFNAGDTKYKAQIEWGYERQILSISRKKTVADAVAGNDNMDLPGTSDSRQMLIDEAPDKFKNWRPNKWGTSVLAMSRIYGPVFVKRFVGTWGRIPLYVEIWPLINSQRTGIEYIVEASFKTENIMTASDERSNLITDLQSKGWLLLKELLKTQLIMERY